jgi:addiction module RelE/StbE family toxin
MKYKLKYSSAYHFDLLETALRLEDYPGKAKRVFEKLDKSLNAVTHMPEMYQVYGDFPIFRKIVVEDYLIFYIVREQDKTIEVHRLINGKMDLPKQFEGM